MSMPPGWPPFRTLDLAAAGRLPDDWAGQVSALADAPERIALIDTPAWSFGIVEGDRLRARLPWLWRLYHGALRDFAGTSLGQPVFASNRLRAALTLNILRGGGATNDWHRDANCVTGVFYAAVPQGAGGLSFRDSDGRTATLVPRAGLFACFPGAIEHRVDPLPEGCERLAIAMVYHASPTDQPAAYGADAYTLDG
ncbi:hypothetical protein [Sphingomonas sp.]|uniref:hypothetical protein n=1 Tax=Sphingomonas sp. TaxID=28214 RepID=UPI00307E399D